jgi:uncharacterized protein YndB with AHSA1/START domain
MARNAVVMDGPVEDVFAVLLDASAYPAWVVGTRRLRDVDPDWPNPGSRFHHVIGFGPFELQDSTKMLACEPPDRLVLEVRFRPMGLATVTITVRPHAGGSALELEEVPAGGPIRSIRGRLLDTATYVRNEISLKRLRRLVERRRRGRSSESLSRPGRRGTVR